MNYFRSGCYDGDFYHEALLCGFHGSVDSDDYGDESGVLPEMTEDFFNFTSQDASDIDKLGDSNAS
jgi:hypothetical protein